MALGTGAVEGKEGSGAQELQTGAGRPGNTATEAAEPQGAGLAATAGKPSVLPAKESEPPAGGPPDAQRSEAPPAAPQGAASRDAVSGAGPAAAQAGPAAASPSSLPAGTSAAGASPSSAPSQAGSATASNSSLSSQSNAAGALAATVAAGQRQPGRVPRGPFLRPELPVRRPAGPLAGAGSSAASAGASSPAATALPSGGSAAQQPDASAAPSSPAPAAQEAAEGQARHASGTATASTQVDETTSGAIEASRVPAAQSAVGPSPDPAPLLGAGVGMQEMIDAIRASVAVASRAGMSQARIAMHPAELGEIRIHLSQTSEGLLARVTAGSEEAARGLLDGRGELHRALSTLGVPLLGLDVGSSGDGAAGQRGTAGQAVGQPGAQPGSSGGAEEEASGAVDIQEAQPASGLSDGGLVNVLA